MNTAYAVLQDQTLFDLSGTLQSANSITVTPYLVGVRLKSIPGTIRAKNNNSTQITLCAPLKLVWKVVALILILSLSASISAIHVQPSCHWYCSRPAPGCFSHPLHSAGNYCFLAIATGSLEPSTVNPAFVLLNCAK